MLSWLVDSTALLSIVLGTAALILIVAWWQTRKRNAAVGAGVALALIAGLVLLGRIVETDAQRIENKIHELVGALRAHDLDRLFSQVAEDFHYRGNDKAQFRQKVTETIRVHNVVDVEVWDFATQEISREKRTARIQFRAKPKGNWDQGVHYRCVADLVLSPDDEWRLKSFEIYNAVGAEPLPIPGY